MLTLPIKKKWFDMILAGVNEKRPQSPNFSYGVEGENQVTFFQSILTEL